MKRRMLAATLLVAVSGGWQQAHAQAAKAIVGKWNIEFERGRRIENGEMTSIMGKGELLVEQQGDSLLATLTQPPREDGTVVPPAKIGGHEKDGSVLFVQKSVAHMNINGEDQALDVVVTWTLKPEGDALSGTVFRDMKGGPMTMTPTPVKGTRAH